MIQTQGIRHSLRKWLSGTFLAIWCKSSTAWRETLNSQIYELNYFKEKCKK